MEERIEVAQARGDGIIATGALSSALVRRLVEGGELVRVRRGYAVTGTRWERASAAERHRLLVRATVAASARPLVVSHLSAAAMHGLPLVGSWPRAVHVSDPGAPGGSSSPGIVAHRGGVHTEGVLADGIAVTPLARTLVDVAASAPATTAVAMLDHALHRDAVRVQGGSRNGRPTGRELTVDRLLRELELLAPRRGRRAAEAAIRFADERAESPGESLSRVRMWELGFEVPELQVRFEAVGSGSAVVDFYWRGIRAIGEFDGRVKYSRGLVLGDRDPAEVVWAEKRREDALRRRSVSFIRWTWEDCASPTRFAAFLTASGVPRARDRTRGRTS